MSFETWLNLIKSAQKTSIISGKARKIHYKFPDGREMAEEYSLETGCVLRRAWKKTKTLTSKNYDEWDVELGEPIPKLLNKPKASISDNVDNNDDIIDISGFYLRESNTEPILTKRITKKNIEWRIRNLPYPINTYQITVDQDKKSIIVRTTNKKYYKTITIPELDRCGLIPEQENITIHHQYNTLIITVNSIFLIDKCSHNK